MSEVTIETAGRTRIVTINRPEARNALTRAVIVGLRDAFDDAAKDAAVRCVILTGAGGHFCGGADLRKNLAEDPNLLDHLEAYLDAYHAVIRAIVRCPKPSIAMLDGCAVGFGADLALACDLRVATPLAYIQEKFVRLGLMPDGGGTFWLPRLVGTARALRWMLLAEKVDGHELERLGLLVTLVAPAELFESTLAVARKIEEGPPLAFAHIKRAVYGSWGDLDDALSKERAGQLELLRSQDAMEGISAWAQKRDPTFEGK
jgi:2-(1,2-epoxy-1,2-dihydrophenyl)acetyl-CoA isomerase